MRPAALPGSQEVQPLFPVPGPAYVPTSHREHLLAPSREYCPAGQSVHLLVLALAYVPALQGQQEVEEQATEPALQGPQFRAPLLPDTFPEPHVLQLP